MATVDPSTATSPTRKTSTSAPEKKYKCQFCNRAFSRSEHRSRHERSHTKERPFKCAKCKSTFVRRDLLLRHDRTVHAKDGGPPLVSEGRKRASQKTQATGATKEEGPSKPSISIDPATLEQIEASSDGMVDLETAAMLMTNFQHKAAAMANGQLHHDGESSELAFSPERTTMLEPSMDYLPGAATLPQMTWDPFMSQPQDHKAHSISSISSQDTPISQQHFSSLSSINPQMPTMMDHGHLSHVLAPHFPSLTDSLPVSGSPTPNALSPFLSMEGPVSPVNYRKSPGPSQALTSPKAPQVQSDDEIRTIHETLAARGVQSPNKETLNTYLSTYFTLFHHHHPFLHPGSFKASQAEPALLCAVLSIGALYSFHEEEAFKLHGGSKTLVNEFLQNKENFDSRKCPLWTMQSTLLNMIFESWSGGSQGLEWACSIKSLLANMVAGNKYELKLRFDARGDGAPSHAEWIFDESCRRTYYAIYNFFGMLTMTYNHTPAISFNEFDSLELPSSESLWSLEIADEHQWRDSLAASTITTVRQAHDSLFRGEAIRYSAFATRVMINALFLEVWNHRRSFESLQDPVLEYRIRIALETWEASLDLCEPETIVVPLSTPHKGHPLIFNAMAMHRNTRSRLEVDLKEVQEALRYHNSYEIAAAMTGSREAVKRTQEMIKVVEQCVECIEIATMQGINWVAKTSGTNWSIEHPLCGMELMIILSLWLWRLEHEEEGATEDELVMYNKVRSLFDQDAIEEYGSKLCSTVARVWGSMFDNGTVWGISKLMGESFKLHGQALIGHEDEIQMDDANLDSLMDPLPMNADA